MDDYDMMDDNADDPFNPKFMSFEVCWPLFFNVWNKFPEIMYKVHIDNKEYFLYVAELSVLFISRAI